MLNRVFSIRFIGLFLYAIFSAQIIFAKPVEVGQRVFITYKNDDRVGKVKAVYGDGTAQVKWIRKNGMTPFFGSLFSGKKRLPISSLSVQVLHPLLEKEVLVPTYSYYLKVGRVKAVFEGQCGTTACQTVEVEFFASARPRMYFPLRSVSLSHDVPNSLSSVQMRDSEGNVLIGQLIRWFDNNTAQVDWLTKNGVKISKPFFVPSYTYLSDLPEYDYVSIDRLTHLPRPY
jgi:hypothetical protein